MPSQPPAGDRPTEPIPASPQTSAPEASAEAPTRGVAPAWRDQFSAVWRYLRWPVFAGVGLLVLFVAGFAWLWATSELPPPTEIGDSALLVDRNGEELALLAQDGLRIEVPLDEMAPNVVDALLAAEDRRFYEHDGIDPLGIARAVWNNVTDNDIEGGSTITQQLVKNVYLDNDRTITRKVREAVLAMKLEGDSSKDEILERYLNTVYFGRGAYGIEAAARTYFDSSAAALEPHESALLMGILRSPESLDPQQATDAAQVRRDAVLEAMAAMGALSADELEANLAQPIEVQDEVAPTRLTAGVGAHFVEQIRQQIVADYGERALYDRGLVVHTTLDIADQRAAEEAVAAHLDDPADPQAAVIGIDRSGAVRAWVGSRDYDELKVDLVTADGGSGRQPGSTFKPLVLAANLEAGYGAGQRFRAPGTITLDTGADEPWEVSNAGGSSYGTLTLAEATVNSVNTVYAQAVLQVGAEAVVDVARRMGVERDLQAQPSIALGTEEVSPLELATVFSTFSRSGRRIDPYRITKIETRDGDVLFELDEPEATQAIPPAVADTVTDVLSDTPRRGTATRAALDRPMAAKTGTTQDNADAWLAGYTPEYTAVVWMGFPEGQIPMDTVDGQRVFGGSIPALIWHDFMAKALEDVEATELPEPDRELLGNRRPDRGDRERSRDRERRRDREERAEADAARSTTTTSEDSTTTTSEPDEGEGTTTTTEGSSTTTTQQSTTTTTQKSSTTTTQKSTTTTTQATTTKESTDTTVAG